MRVLYVARHDSLRLLFLVAHENIPPTDTGVAVYYRLE